MSKNSSLDLTAPGFHLEAPLLNGKLDAVIDGPFKDVDRYTDRIGEALAAQKAADAALDEAKATHHEAEEEADRLAVLADIGEAKEKDAERARKATEAAAAAVAEAEDTARIKRKAVAALRGIKDTAARKATEAARRDAEKVRAEKVEQLAEALRAAVSANAELHEIESRMQARGLLEQRAAIADVELLPRHHSMYLRPGTPGVMRDTRVWQWFERARRQGYNV